MAEEQRTILIDIEVEDRNFDQELANVNSQLRKNREEIKELSKDYEENAEEIAKLELANKELSASKREITKASQTEANSLNALRLRLANLTKERNNLDTSIEGNVERFNQLQKEIKSTSDEIKGFEEAGGDFRRNVGNYTDSVGEAVSETQFFGVSVNDLGAVFTSTTALIGAAVGVLSGLVKAYASSARGAEDLQRATDRLNEVYNTFSQTLADTFGGDGEGGILDKALDFVLQRTTSVTTQVRAEIATSAAAALRELEVLEIQEERDAKQRLQRAEQLRQIRDDETSGINERIKANEELFNVISVREQAIIDFQNRRLQQLQLQLRLDPENLELRKEILRTEFEIADIQEESEGFRSEALINRVSLNKELLELTERRQLIELEARDARIQDIEISDQELEARQNLEIFRLEQQEKLRDAELIRREQLLENEELTESQRQLIIERSEQRILDIKKDATKKEVDLAKKRSDQIAAAQAQLTQSIIALLGQQSAAGKAFALTQIISDSARGVSGAVAAGAGIPFPGNLAAIASGVASVLAGIAQARAIFSQDSGFGGSFSPLSIDGEQTALNVAETQTQSPTIIQPQLLSQFSQPVFAQQELINATTQQPEVVNVVQVTDIVKGLNANQVVVNESSLGG